LSANHDTPPLAGGDPQTTRGGRRLAGRVALVTGGARRIGRHLVVALARAGVRVVVHYHHSRDEAEALVHEVASFDDTITPPALVQGDLHDPDVTSRLVEAAAAHFGPVDILINNAAIFERGSLTDATLRQWDRHQAINLRAPFLLCQAFARQLPADGEGDVINLNDYRILRPDAEHLAYTVSKVGLHALTRCLARALAPRVRVNELGLGAILPPEVGPASTSESAPVASESVADGSSREGYVHTRKQDIPLRRFGSPSDVAAALLQLLRSRNLTGQTIYLDGGCHMV